MTAARGGRIVVAAGTNGAGKSTIVQPFVQMNGGYYFNPDEYTRGLVATGMPPQEANATAWNYGFRQLQDAIDDGKRYSFETTLGGNTIPAELMRALAMGCEVTIIYVGLASPELHIQRVAERVRRGGHHIPEDKIRERYRNSLANLASFIGTQASIRVFDNSEQSADGTPMPFEVLRIEGGAFSFEVPPKNVPRWAQSLVLRAAKFYEL